MSLFQLWQWLMSDVPVLISGHKLFHLNFPPKSCWGWEVQYNHLNWIKVLEETHVSIYFIWLGLPLKNNRNLYFWLFKWRVGSKIRNWYFCFHTVERNKRSKGDVYYYYISVRLLQEHYSKHMNILQFTCLFLSAYLSLLNGAKCLTPHLHVIMSNFLFHLPSSFL